MNLSEHDLEFILQLYDSAVPYMSDKAKGDFATDFIFKLGDYGFDLKASAKEIGDHDIYLDKAMEEFLESEEEYGEPEEEWYDDEDIWDD